MPSNGLTGRKVAVGIWGGGAERVTMKITISFSGRTSLKQLENISNLERMKQFHGYGFPGDPAVFLSLLTNYACHWRDGASLKRNKQAKVAKEFGSCKWKLISLHSKAHTESS